MAINVLSTFVEEIEREFRNHLPQKCINILATMCEEQRVLQRAINDQMAIIEKLKQVMVLSAAADQLLIKQIKNYNDTNSDQYNDIIKSQDMGDDS